MRFAVLCVLGVIGGAALVFGSLTLAARADSPLVLAADALLLLVVPVALASSADDRRRNARRRSTRGRAPTSRRR